MTALLHVVGSRVVHLSAWVGGLRPICGHQGHALAAFAKPWWRDGRRRIEMLTPDEVARRHLRLCRPCQRKLADLVAISSNLGGPP